MAYCIPYTYTDLLNHLKYLENRPGGIYGNIQQNSSLVLASYVCPWVG